MGGDCSILLRTSTLTVLIIWCRSAEQSSLVVSHSFYYYYFKTKRRERETNCLAYHAMLRSMPRKDSSWLERRNFCVETWPRESEKDDATQEDTRPKFHITFLHRAQQTSVSSPVDLSTPTSSMSLASLMNSFICSSHPACLRNFWTNDQL